MVEGKVYDIPKDMDCVIVKGEHLVFMNRSCTLGIATSEDAFVFPGKKTTKVIGRIDINYLQAMINLIKSKYDIHDAADEIVISCDMKTQTLLPLQCRDIFLSPRIKPEDEVKVKVKK